VSNVAVWLKYASDLNRSYEVDAVRGVPVGTPDRVGAGLLALVVAIALAVTAASSLVNRLRPLEPEAAVPARGRRQAYAAPGGVVVGGVVVVVPAAGPLLPVEGAGRQDGRLAWTWVTSWTRWAVTVEPSADAWTLTVSPTFTERMPS